MGRGGGGEGSDSVTGHPPPKLPPSTSSCSVSSAPHGHSPSLRLVRSRARRTRRRRAPSIPQPNLGGQDERRRKSRLARARPLAVNYGAARLQVPLFSFCMCAVYQGEARVPRSHRQAPNRISRSGKLFCQQEDGDEFPRKRNFILRKFTSDEYQKSRVLSSWGE